MDKNIRDLQPVIYGIITYSLVSLHLPGLGSVWTLVIATVVYIIAGIICDNISRRERIREMEREDRRFGKY